MKKTFFILLMVACILAGCSNLRQVAVVQHATHDTLYLSTVRYDSVFVDNRQVIDHFNDTVVIREILRENHYRLLRDTVRVAKTDSIPVIHTVEVVKRERYIPSVYKWSLAISISSS